MVMIRIRLEDEEENQSKRKKKAITRYCLVVFFVFVINHLFLSLPFVPFACSSDVNFSLQLVRRLMKINNES